MKILVLGAGGREHTLAWKIAQSPKCSELFIAPGNAGTDLIGTNIPINPLDFTAIEAFVDQEQIDMIVVGPEQPLVQGIVDHFNDRKVSIIGPNRSGARLEGSKAFSKSFMQRHNIPTARYAIFDTHQLDAALACLQDHPLPIVVKASGLAAGKGVLICDTARKAEIAVKDMLSGSSFGEAGKTVVIEEFLQGFEISIFVLTDGHNYKLLPAAKDYKRIGEGDMGLNTGGMGAVSPVPFANHDFLRNIESDIVRPTLDGLRTDGIDYKGFIFIGLMIVGEIPYVLEYNVRLGDPETEVILPRITSDLLDLFEKTANGHLDQAELSITQDYCTTVMLVSGGYPGSYEKGMRIMGLEAVRNSMVFHAGTKSVGDETLTNGGRVLAITSLAGNLNDALQESLRNAEIIQFEKKYFRRDIGRDLM